jgi:class 3 adenylate cyclase
MDGPVAGPHRSRLTGADIVVSIDTLPSRPSTPLEITPERASFVAEARAERRLAAILATDVVGYSRLMGGDEEGTLAALKSLRKCLIDPKIAEHRGRIVKTTGDGAFGRVCQRGRRRALCN